MLLSDKALAVGHIPSGRFIGSVQDTSGNTVDGCRARWVQRVAFAPLGSSLSIQPGRPAYDLIKAGHVFALNIVGDHDKTFLKHFWRGYDPAKNPFDELPHKVGTNGGIILDQAKSAIECKMISSVTPGDHEVV